MASKRFRVGVFQNEIADVDAVSKVRRAVSEVTNSFRKIPFETDSKAKPWDFEIVDCGVFCASKTDTDQWDLVLLITKSEVDKSEVSQLLAKCPRLAFIRDSDQAEVVQPVSSGFLPWPLDVEGDLVSIVRKIMLKVRNEDRGYHFSPIETEQEIESYLRLRFKTWRREGYLNAKLRTSGFEFEVDALDRHAFPIGVWTSERKTLMGCIRLVYPHERKASDFGNLVGTFVEDHAARLHEVFEPEHQLSTMSFDVLEAIDGFRSYYQRLFTASPEVRLGEIGRVITSPRFRRKSVAYSLVETALSQAQQDGIHAVFLACKVEHVSLYTKLGFEVLDGTSSNTFINGINQPCVAMGISLDRERVEQESFRPRIAGKRL